LDLAHAVLFIVLGALFGAVGGIFGIGGGLLGIPILGVFFGLDQQHAQGTAMVMIAPNVVIGLYQYWKRGGLDLRIAVALALSAMTFTYFGAQVATHVPSRPLRLGFAAFQLLLALYVAVRAWRETAPPVPSGRPRRAWPAAVPLGALGGVISGLFGVGGAVFAVPFLTGFFDFTQAQAQGMGLALVMPGTAVAITAYTLAHDIEWGIGIPLAIGGVWSVRYGVALAYRLPDRVLRFLFAGLLVASGVALIAKA
jgi:uncharacterized membrane protein YfcA